MKVEFADMKNSKIELKDIAKVFKISEITALKILHFHQERHRSARKGFPEASLINKNGTASIVSNFGNFPRCIKQMLTALILGRRIINYTQNNISIILTCLL